MGMFWETRWPILNSGGHGTKTTHFLASDLHNIMVVRTAYLANRSEKVKNTPTSERSSNLKNKVTQMKSIHMCYTTFSSDLQNVFNFCKNIFKIFIYYSRFIFKIHSRVIQEFFFFIYSRFFCFSY